MPRINYDQGGSQQTALATPGATATAIGASEYAVPEGSVAVVRWRVFVANAGLTAAATFVVTQSVRRPAGGNAALVGATKVEPERDAALLLTGVSVEASGAVVRVRATGLAATNLTWWVAYEADVGGAP